MNERFLMSVWWLAIAVCVPMTGLILFMSPVLWKIPIHNMKLSAYQRHFASIVHPKGTTLVAGVRDFGGFGNSNHCDYFVGEFRSSDLPRETVVRHYQGLFIPPPDELLGVWDGAPPQRTGIEVYFLDDEIFQHWPWSDWLNSTASRLPEDRQNVYLAFALQDGYPPIGDFRCH
ncbi:MAG: hypothetical protein AAB728_02395 [Patescibacteria group bacterium]